MASNFPSSLDTFTNPSSTDAMDSVSVPHATQHSDLNDAVEALQAKVGADSSAVTSSHDYKIAALESISHGKILQVVSTTKTDTFSASLAPGADTAITGLSATITPSSTSSKILAVVNVSGSEVDVPLPYLGVRLYRGATQIGSGAASSNRTEALAAVRLSSTSGANIVSVTGNYLDSPATTSATTYAVHLTSLSTSTRTHCVNRSSSDADDEAYARTSSTITLFEVSA